MSRSWALMWLIMKTAGAKSTKDMKLDFPLPLHINLQPGARSSKDALTFNPNFSEIMGWPIDWSEPNQPVMEWSP